MKRPLACLALALSWAAAGCVPGGGTSDYGDPTSLATPTEVDGIVAWVAEPALEGALDDASPEVVIAAYVEGDAEQALDVRLSRLVRDAEGNDQVAETRTASREGEGEEQRFRVQVGLLHGVNRFLAYVETPDQRRVRRLSFSLLYDGAAPGIALRVLAPGKGDGEPCRDPQPIAEDLTNASEVCVRGEVTTRDDAGARVTLSISKANDSATVDSDDQGMFEAALSLAKDTRQTVTATARDEAGNETTTRAELVQDGTAPKLSINTPARETSASSLVLEGTASDASGVAGVELQSDGQTELRADDPAEWTLEVQLRPGDSQFELVARDRAGNEARQTVVLVRRRTLWLGPPDEGAGATDLELDRDAIAELLTVENQRDTEVVAVDVKPTVRESLERIREPERFGVDTSAWGDPERNLQRILAMTADNADLSGTSLEELLEIAEGLGLPAPRVLAQLLDLGVTEPIVNLDALTQVVMEQLVGTHPNIGRDGDAYVIEVDLYDVLNDLTTLAPRFGPAGDHPGFLAGESYSPVLEPGFRVTFPVETNLVQYDAVDLSRATKDFHFLIEGDRVLDFNILSDDFSVVGLQDEPTVDLRFVLGEHPGPGRLAAGTTREAQPDPDDPGFYRGDGEGWGIDPWLFERISVEAAYRLFHRRYEADGFARTLRYDTGAITDAAVVEWERGWVTITTAGGVGSPPDPVYVWDFIMEVAQVRLHDGGIAEGAANMGFALTDVPIGLTADELVEKLKPSLNEQEAQLSEQLVGELGLAVPRAELFYMPADGDGDGALAFPAPEDSEADYPYTTPGFFSDADLMNKVSSTGAGFGVSDTTHEKVRARVGATYYATDEEGMVYAIEIVERDGDQIGVQVRMPGGLQ